MLKKTIEQDTEKRQDFKSLVGFLSETLKENKKTGILALSTLLGLSALSSVQPVILQLLTNAASGVVATGTMTSIAIGAAVGYGILEAGNNYIRRLSDVTTNWFLTRFGNKLIQKNMKTIIKMPRLVQKAKIPSYLAEVLGRAAGQGKNTLGSASWAVINGGSFLLSGVILLATAPVIAGALIAVTAGKAWASTYQNKLFKKAQQAVAKKQGHNAARTRDVLEKAVFVRSHNKEDEEIATTSNLLQHTQLRAEKIQAKRLRFDGLMKIVDVIGSFAITIPAIYAAMKTGDIGTYFLVTGSAYRVLYGGSSAVSSYSSAQENFLSYQESLKELEYDKSLEPRSGERTLDNCQGNVTFKNVSFAYTNQEHNVLDGLDLSIKKGERAVIVGRTGCGKSTLVNLLKHEMEIKEGSIEIDGVDVRSLRTDNLNNQIAYVEQKPEFLKRSIRENLLFVKPEATPAEIDDCMKKAGLYDEIMQRTEGYDTVPTSLSGGQQQRLAIAQAFLKSAPIVIMDEPTSALDRYTAREVLDTILAFGKDKTLILISHNPAEIAKADRALLLKDGKIVEQGAPKDLIAQRGYFYGLYRDELDLFNAVKAQTAQTRVTDTVRLAVVKGNGGR